MADAVPRREARRTRVLFLVALALTTFQAFVLVVERRVPAGSESAVDFPWSYLDAFLHNLLLLLGAWLLGTRHFRSPATLFLVSVAAAGSSHATDRAFSTLPLMLYFLHEFLDAGSRRALLLAGVLAALQPTLVPAAAALYWIGSALLFGYPLRQRLSDVSWGLRDTAGAVAIVGLGVFVAVTLPVAGGPSGLRNPLGFLDLLVGLSPRLDAAVFCGYLTIAFAAVALIHLGARMTLRVLAMLLGSLLLLSLLSPPSTQGLARLAIVFLAGVGFDRRTARGASPVAVGLLLNAAVLALLSFLAALSLDVMTPTLNVLTLGVPADRVWPLPRQSLSFQELTGMSALMSGLAAGSLLLCASGGRRAPIALALILLIHPLDVHGSTFRSTWLKSVPAVERPALVRPATWISLFVAGWAVGVAGRRVWRGPR